MPNLLNDRLFYVALFSIESCTSNFSSYSILLWEILGTNPGSILEFCLTARGHRSWDSKFIPESFDGRLVDAYLMTVVGEQRTTSFESLLNRIRRRLDTPQLAYSFKSKLKELEMRLVEYEQELVDHGLREYPSYAIKASWSVDIGTNQPRTHSDAAWAASGPFPTFGIQTLIANHRPLFHGLQKYLEVNREALLHSVLQHCLKRLPLLDGPFDQSTHKLPEYPSGRDLQSILARNRGARLICGTAGTGKITAIQAMVRHNFGIYCLPPNLKPSKQLPCDMEARDPVVTPYRAYASRDTYSMYEDLEALGKLDPKVQRWDKFVAGDKHVPKDIAVRPLKVARLQLLDLVKNLSNYEKDMAQTKWIQLQISCWPGNDPFDAVYRLIRLESNMKLRQAEHRLAKKVGYVGHNGSKSLWTFDEAQIALSDPLAKDMMTALMDHPFKTDLCLSGTSLNMHQMVQF